MPLEGERLASLEQQVLDARQDVLDVKVELGHVRRRLHDLEGFSAAFLAVQKENRRGEATQYRHLEVRIQVLTLIVAVTAVVTTVATAILIGR
jgi:hypothetical protein